MSLIRSRNINLRLHIFPANGMNAIAYNVEF